MATAVDTKKPTHFFDVDDLRHAVFTRQQVHITDSSGVSHAFPAHVGVFFGGLEFGSADRVTIEVSEKKIEVVPSEDSPDGTLTKMLEARQRAGVASGEEESGSLYKIAVARLP